MTPARRAAASLSSLLLLSGALAGCGDGADDSGASGPAASAGSPAASGSAGTALCDDLDALRASTADLGDISLGKGALPAVSQQLVEIQATLRLVPADASAQYSPQTQAVSAAASRLRSGLAAATSDPSAATLAAVGADVRALGTAVGDLARAVGNSC